MSDVTVLRALVEGDDSNLDTVLARSDRKILDWARKTRPAPRLTITDNTGAVRSRVAELDRDLSRLSKRAARINVGINIPKNAARDLKDISGLQLKSQTATYTINRAGNADPKQLRDIARIASQLKDKSVTLTVNWQQNGTPPPPMPNGSGGAGPMPPGGSVPIAGPRSPQRRGWNDRMSALQSRGYSNVAGGAVLSSVFTAPLVAGGAAITKFSSDYEEAMQHLVTLTDVGKDELGALKKEVLQLSDDPRIRQGPIELAEALYFVSSSGLKGADGMKVLKAAALGTSAGLGETKVVASNLITVMEAYGLSADKAGRIVDTVTEAVRKGIGEADQYASAFPKVIAIAAQAGVSFEEVAAQMASATRVGLKPSETATALRQLFNNIIDPSEKAQRAMKALGTSVGELRIMLKEKGLFNTLKDLQERTGGRIGPITELFGNIRALTSFLSTTGNATLQGYKDTLKSIEEAHDSTGKSAAIASETLAFQMDRLRAAFQRALIETGDKVLPRLTPLIESIGKQLPDGIMRAVQTWDKLDPVMQKAMIGMVGVLAISGPLKMLIGTVQILGSALGGMAMLAATGLPGLLILGTIAIAAALAGGKLVDMKEEMDAAANEADTLARSLESVNKHLKAIATVSAGATSATKNGLKKLSDDAVAAKDDTGKLLAVIKEAVAMKVAVGKDTHLDPAGKAVVSNEIDRLIADLSARTINLKVNLDKDGNVVPDFVARVEAAAGKKTPRAVQLTENDARENSWAARAKRAGLPLNPNGARPPAKIAEPSGISNLFGLTAGTVDNRPAVQAWDAEVARNRDAIVQWEKAHPATAQVSTAKATQTATVALTEQTKAVTELKDAELGRERARLTKIGSVPGAFTTGSANFNAEAYTRYQKVVEEWNTRQKRIQDAWQTKKDADKERDIQAEENRVKAAEETARRLREIEAKSIAERLSMWNSFGNSVEGVIRQTGTVGAEKSDTQRWALDAQMAKREFADIPKPLRDIVVGLGAINDEMKALTDTRNEMRGMFDDMFKSALRSGADLKPIREAAAFMEKNLDYERKMSALYQRGARGSKKVIDYAEGQRAALSTRQEQLQEAGKTRSDIYSENGVGSGASGNVAVSIMQGIARQFDGAQIPSACATVASKMMNAIGINIKPTAGAAQLRKNAIAMGAKEISMAEAKAGDLINWVGAKYGANGSRNHVGVYEGNGYFSGNGGGKNKNPAALHQKVYDLANAHFYNTSDFARGASPVPKTKPGEMPASTARAGVPLFPSPAQVSAKGVPTLPVKGARDYNAPNAPGYNGDLLQMGLPKGWGKRVTDQNLAPGETRAWQLKYQEMISDTQKATKAARQQGMSLDEYAAMWRRIAEKRDASDSIIKATEEARKRGRDLARSSDLTRSGRSGELSTYFLDGARGAHRYTPKALREGEIGGMVDNSISESVAATRDFNRALFDRNKVLAAGRPFLRGAVTDMAEYERAMAMAQKRVEIWNEPDLKKNRDDIASLMENARRAGAKGDVKTVIARTGQARDLQAAHDFAFKTRMDSSENEFNAGAARKAQVDLAAQQVAAREESSLLDFEMGLIARGIANSEERSKLVEMERIRRNTIKQLVDSQPYNSPAEYEAFKKAGADAANTYGQNVDRQAGFKASDEETNFGNASVLKRKMLTDQLATAGRYSSDNPELAIQLRLLEERNRLETDNLTRVEESKINVDDRLATIEKEIRAEAVLARFQTERANLLEAQNGALDAQKQNELALATTAREKLEIEWKYTDALRARAGITTSSDELAAREQQADAAAEGERMGRYRSEAEQMSGIFHDSIRDGFDRGIGAGLKGLGKRVFDAMMEAQITKWSRGMVGLPDDPSAATSGGILDVFKGKGPSLLPKKPTWQRDGGNAAPADLFTRIQDGISGRGGLFGGLPSFTPDARAVPTMPSGAAGGAMAMLNSLSAGVVNITTPLVNANAGTINMSEGISPLSSLHRPANGGAGSSPDPITQALRLFSGF